MYTVLQLAKKRRHPDSELVLQYLKVQNGIEISMLCFNPTPDSLIFQKALAKITSNLKAEMQ